jgi:hypothetical protein
MTCLSAACLWGQVGEADIYVWTDENNVKHLTNQAPPPHAQILMHTKEIPYDEAADRARRENDRREEMLQAQADLREREARLAEQQAEAQRRLEAAERRAEEALERVEDLLESYPYGYNGNTVGYWPYGFSTYGYRWYGGWQHGKPSLYGRGHYGFDRRPFDGERHFRKPYGERRFHRNHPQHQMDSGRRQFTYQRLDQGRFSPFRRHSGGRTQFNGRLNGGAWRR